MDGELADEVESMWEGGLRTAERRLDELCRAADRNDADQVAEQLDSIVAALVTMLTTIRRLQERHQLKGEEQ
jgi:hypothetical protein